jgi:uncharacterized protein
VQISKLHRIENTKIRPLQEHAAPRKLNELQIIVKVAERCNLACTYCYYYFMGDKSFEGKDPVMREAVFLPLAQFLADGVVDLSLKKLSVTFHGGEPLLLKPERFNKLCETLTATLSSIVELSLSVQTNGVLLDANWLEIFARHRVNVGISIDGPKHYQDRYRLDSKSRGSYDAVASGLMSLVSSEKGLRTNSAGTLSVMNAEFDPVVVFRHLTDEFAVKHLGFLLPDVSWDTGFPVGQSAELYGAQLSRLFDAWLERDDVYVREMQRAVDFFQTLTELSVKQNDTSQLDVLPEVTDHNDIVVVQSTGHIAVDDSLIPALAWRVNTPSPHLSQISLRDFVSSAPFHELQRSRETLPTKCGKCEWKLLCRGGVLENRFGNANGFNNPSVYCAGLKIFFNHVYERLVEGGYPEQMLRHRLEAGIPGASVMKEYA